MLKMVDGTGIIGVDMVCPLGGAVSPPQPPNYDNIEMEGVGSLVLPNSLKAPLERVELIGNSVQGENPAPDNPQEIKSAGKFDEASGKYLIDVKVTGKNLLPKEIVLINNNNNDAETITYDEENHQYILQMKENNTNQVVFMFYLHLKKGIYTIRRNIIVDGVLTNKKDIAVKNANTNVSLVNKYNNYYSTFEVPEDMKVLINAGDYTGKKNKDAIIYDLQLEYGDTPTPYEPYQEPQTLTLTSDRPITKWDKLVEQGGSMGWLNSGKIAKEFTFVSKASDENISGRIRRRFKTSLNGKFPQTDKVMCNFLTTDNVRNDYSIGIVGSGDIYIYFYENTGVETLEQANHWLKNLPFEKTIIFERKTTEFIPLSQEEQTQLRNLHSYNGTTNIMVDSGEVECGIKLTYRKEI